MKIKTDKKLKYVILVIVWHTPFIFPVWPLSPQLPVPNAVLILSVISLGLIFIDSQMLYFESHLKALFNSGIARLPYRSLILKVKLDESAGEGNQENLYILSHQGRIAARAANWPTKEKMHNINKHRYLFWPMEQINNNFTKKSQKVCLPTNQDPANTLGVISNNY